MERLAAHIASLSKREIASHVPSSGVLKRARTDSGSEAAATTDEPAAAAPAAPAVDEESSDDDFGPAIPQAVPVKKKRGERNRTAVLRARLLFQFCIPSPFGMHEVVVARLRTSPDSSHLYLQISRLHPALRIAFVYACSLCSSGTRICAVGCAAQLASV